VLTAGIAALLLSLGGLTYVLLNDGHGNGGGGTGGTNGSGASGGSVSGGTADGGGPASGRATPSGEGTAATGDGGAAATGSGPSPSERPRQSVHVRVHAIRAEYRGTCPPPEAEAPAFRATVTVGSVPVSVGYRWVTASGRGTDGGWKTLDFPSGEGKSREIGHVERTHTEGAVHHDRLRLEIRSPVAARSEWVAFSVACEEESPTGAPSSPGGPAYSVGSGQAADRNGGR
jgi:hypothetical protein